MQEPVVDPVGFEYLRSYFQAIKRNHNVLVVYARDNYNNYFKAYIQYPHPPSNRIQCVLFQGQYDDPAGTVELTDTNFLRQSTLNTYLYFEIVDFNNHQHIIERLDRRTRSNSVHPRTIIRNLPINTRRQNYGRRRRQY